MRNYFETIFVKNHRYYARGGHKSCSIVDQSTLNKVFVFAILQRIKYTKTK